MEKLKKIKKTKLKSEKPRYEISSGDLFKDFGYANPEEAKVKWELAYLIRSIIKENDLTQEMTAELIGIDQPKVSKIVRGILSEFTIDRLMKYLVALGYDIEIYPRLRKSEITPSIHVRSSSLKRLSV